jgi:hypothetical protein
MSNIVTKVANTIGRSARFCQNFLFSIYKYRFELLSKIKAILAYLFLFLVVPGVGVCKLRSQLEQEERMFLRMTINVAYYAKVVILVVLYCMYER